MITPYTIQRAQSGEQAAQLAIITELTPIIKKLSRHWQYKDKQDAMQAGAEGVLIAINKYNVLSPKIDFSYFAYTYIHRKLIAEFARINGLKAKDLIEYQKAQYKDPKPVTLPNGIRVKDIEALMNISSAGLQEAEAKEDALDCKIQLDMMIERLPERMQDILNKLRMGYTQKQTAEYMGLEYDQVSRLYQAAKKMLNALN